MDRSPNLWDGISVETTSRSAARNRLAAIFNGRGMLSERLYSSILAIQRPLPLLTSRVLRAYAIGGRVRAKHVLPVFAGFATLRSLSERPESFESQFYEKL
jgi:hypothetical protein